MKPKTDEEIIRIAEILLDSSTQKALRGLAYLRVLRERVNKRSGSAQFTLTHVNTPEFGTSKKKKWHMPPPKDEHNNPEHHIIAKCFHCGAIFEKTSECPKCHLYVCPKCGKCGCQLSEEARNAVYCVLESVFGYVQVGESYWRSEK
jgi:hypothetical protein